jgi:hypothetical protein
MGGAEIPDRDLSNACAAGSPNAFLHLLIEPRRLEYGSSDLVGPYVRVPPRAAHSQKVSLHHSCCWVMVRLQILMFCIRNTENQVTQINS